MPVQYNWDNTFKRITGQKPIAFEIRIYFICHLAIVRVSRFIENMSAVDISSLVRRERDTRKLQIPLGFGKTFCFFITMTIIISHLGFTRLLHTRRVTLYIGNYLLISPER